MIDTGQATDVGIQREVNQDSAGVGELGDSLLLVVADGMGGHAAGEAAARIVVDAMFDRFEKGMGGDPRDNLYFGAQDAHRGVLMYAGDHGTLGMGSTMVAAYIRGDDIWVSHVGDSRFYLFREGRIAYRTTDHTRVQNLLEIGAITPEEAKKHPEGNIITRAVGHDRQDGGGKPFEADVLAEPLKLQAGDTLLLCSDGLYDLVDDTEMIEVVSGLGAEPACQRLVALANERGGHDNITVVILHCAGGTSPPPKVEEAPVRSTADTLEDPIDAPDKVGGRGEAPEGPTRALYSGPAPDEPPPEPADVPIQAIVAVLALLIVLGVGWLLMSSGEGGAKDGSGSVAPAPATDAAATPNTPDAAGDSGEPASPPDVPAGDDAAGPDPADPAQMDDDDSGEPTTEGEPPSPELPDTAEPDTAEPDTAAPDTAAPDTAEPDTVEPDTAEPDTAEPDTAEPDTAEPDTAEPDTPPPSPAPAALADPPADDDDSADALAPSQ